MKRTKALKCILASLLVTVSLAVPAVLSAGTVPDRAAELHFTGLRLKTLADGSVQALVDVSVDRLHNIDGAAFILQYNPEYLTPSDYDTNAPLASGDPQNTVLETDAFFAYASDICPAPAGDDGSFSPFRREIHYFDSNWEYKEDYYSKLEPGVGRLRMDLFLDREGLLNYLGTGLEADYDPSATGKLKILTGLSAGGTDVKEDRAYVFNKYESDSRAPDYDATQPTAEKITLGTLSFRVEAELLPEIARYFPETGGQLSALTVDPTVSLGGNRETYLLRADPTEAENWQIGCFRGNLGERTHRPYQSSDNAAKSDPADWAAAALYRLTVDNSVIWHVEAAEREVTVNAYQAYFNGQLGDLALTLGKFSPMATVTYVDGRQENLVIPWGRSGSGWSVLDITNDRADDGAFHTALYDYVPENWPDAGARSYIYDPTGNHSYLITQYVPGEDSYPIPIRVRLTVTPITLLELQVEDQVRTYRLDSVVNQVRNGGELRLPDEARLITDVVPGGVSLVIPIPGWRPLNGSWPRTPEPGAPNPGMTTILEDTWTAGADPHWPGDNQDDQAAIGSNTYQDFLHAETYTFPNPDYDSSLPEDADNPATLSETRWLGEYTFRMAEGYGTFDDGNNPIDSKFKDGFTGAELQAVYPWLTVPQVPVSADNPDGLWLVPRALRRIVPGPTQQDQGPFTEASDYRAAWVSTVTQGESDPAALSDGQPTLTLSVSRVSGPMSEGSIFRVWLPDGQELGTGVDRTVWPAYDGDLSDDDYADDWFPLIRRDEDGALIDADDDTTPVLDQYENGFYTPEAQINGSTYFHLVTNPGDPTRDADVYAAQRETLRRWINLGGWFQIAVCEDPATKVWSDPIPVYVPPRANLYDETKTYNFIGENTGLVPWTGAVLKQMPLPRGTYTTVSDDGLPLYNVNGVPVDEQTLLTAAGYEEYRTSASATSPIRPVASLERYTEDYGLATTYDPLTGAQPGVLHTFRVGEKDPNFPDDATKGDQIYDKWDTTTPATPANTSASSLGGALTIAQYGPDDLYDGANYANYGLVYQPGGAAHQVTLRRPEDVAGTGKQHVKGISLTSIEPNGITREIPGDLTSNVTLATYDTRMVGYTTRQDYTFTITNHSDEPIYGLQLDLQTDGYPTKEEGGHFVLLQPPADYLPPFGSTTFTLTYVYGLSPQEEYYRDTIYLISSDTYPGADPLDENGNPVTGPVTGHPNSPYQVKGRDYLLSFDALFYVTASQTHNVTVITRPGDGKMGTAGLIVGEVGAAGSESMNYATTTRSYAKDNNVYVVVNLLDEYTVESVTCVDAAGNTIPIPLYTGPASVRDGTLVYTFKMPDYDATVTVNFEETVFAKLRLSDLIDFSAPGNERYDDNGRLLGLDAPTDKLKDNINDTHFGQEGATPPYDVIEPYTYKVWRKSFTAGERSDALNWAYSKVPGSGPTSGIDVTLQRDLALMTMGRAIPGEAGNRFLPSENQYLVVIPYDADFSQVQATLRKVAMADNYAGVGQNLDIDPTVTMHWFGADVLDTWNATLDGADPVLDSTNGYGGIQGHTAGPSTHISKIFPSPAVGESNYVRVTISLDDTVRCYYVEIHRAPRDPISTMMYGNSPYGMIMNAGNFVSTSQTNAAAETAAARNAAKREFTKGYTFSGLNEGNLPNVLKAAQGTAPAVDTPVYWREAWVKNTRLYEPESYTGTGTDETVTDPSTGQTTVIHHPDETVYSDAWNLDLNDYAFFATLGRGLREPGVHEVLDSSGRPVDVDTVRCQVTVRLLDTAAATQVGRFSGTGEVTLDLGRQGRALAWHGAADGLNWAVSSHIETSTDAEGNVTEKTVYEDVDHILPGQYVLEYVYTDFDGANTLKALRPFVILPENGDVNADLTVDSTRAKAGGKALTDTDEYVLENRVADPLGYAAGGWDAAAGTETGYLHANIFKFRVCDVNNDRNVNNIDGNLIDQNARAGKANLRFYNPERYFDSAPLWR